MRSQVHRFQVDVHDIYADARASMVQPPRRRWPMALLTTTAAVVLGATVGWMIADAEHVPAAGTPASLAPIDVGLSAGPANRPVSLQASEPAARKMPAGRVDGQPSRFAGAGQHAADAAGAPTASAGWPIVLHRAGDGRFYADLSLEGHLVNILVDPGARTSLLTPAFLPSGALPAGSLPEGAEWQAVEVILEHLRLSPTRFPVSDEPTAEATIGADLLARHFIVEEQFDRLRLVPRQGGS